MAAGSDGYSAAAVRVTRLDLVPVVSGTGQCVDTSQTPPSVNFCQLTLGSLEVERHMFASEAACHAAIRQGDPNLNWNHCYITDQDAQWIASALANPVVRSVVPLR
jgi:hypothetical protein